MKHERATHAPDFDCGPYGCNTCNLFICSMCGRAEGSAGAIDFVVDKWIVKDAMVTVEVRR